MDYIKREAFVSADPTYQQLEQAASELRDSTSKRHADITKATYKLQRLLIMRDVVLKQMFEMEDTTTETDELLENLTANSGEAWCGMISQGVEDLQLLICDVCEEVAQARKEHDERNKRREEAWAKVHKRSQELRKEWDAKQSEATK
jgi:hypothetical protein